MQKIWVLLIVTVFRCGCCFAQSVSPAVMEYTAAAEGRFELSNDSLQMLVVTVEAKSFTIDREGEAHFTPLSPQIHVDLSTTQLRLLPKQKRTVFYRATAASYPAWFCIYSGFANPSKHGGVNVQLEMPHTVYLLGKQQAHVADLKFSDVHREGNTLTGVLHNHASNMVRVRSVDALDAHAHKDETGGFPLLPGNERVFSIALGGHDKPERVRARMEHFVVEQSVQ